jgi:hypothetical protein
MMNCFEVVGFNQMRLLLFAMLRALLDMLHSGNIHPVAFRK